MEGDRWIYDGRLIIDISIHALRVEGDAGGRAYGFILIISIHALRVEGDRKRYITIRANNRFLSTPSVWRATYPYHGGYFAMIISIHALRVEGDLNARLKGAKP